MKKLLSHIQLQLLTGLRDPAYFFSTIILPAGVYWIFGVPEATSSYIGTFLCCSFSAFSFFGVFFFQYSISTAQEKESDWTLYMRTLPARASTKLIARFITSSLLGILSCVLIYILTKTLTPSDMSLITFIKMLVTLILGSPVFLLMGLFIGNIFSPKSIIPVSNFFHLTLSFAGGLWKPPEILPEALHIVYPYLPTYHYGMLVWPLAIPDVELDINNILALLYFSIGFMFILIIQKKLSRGSI